MEPKCQRRTGLPGRTWCGQRPALLSTMTAGPRRHTFVMCGPCRDLFRALGWTVETVAGADLRVAR